MVEVLRERGYHVAGDLDDLLPCFSDAKSRPAVVADAAIADAAIAALVSTSEQYGRYWWRTRRRDRPTPASGGARIGSLARAAGFRARMAALNLADQHPLVDRVAARYLRRSGR